MCHSARSFTSRFSDLPNKGNTIPLVSDNLPFLSHPANRCVSVLKGTLCTRLIVGAVRGKGRGGEGGRTQGLHIHYSALLPPTVSPVKSSSLAGWLGKKARERDRCSADKLTHTRVHSRTQTGIIIYQQDFKRKERRTWPGELKKDRASGKNKNGGVFRMVEIN